VEDASFTSGPKRITRCTAPVPLPRIGLDRRSGDAYERRFATLDRLSRLRCNFCCDQIIFLDRRRRGHARPGEYRIGAHDQLARYTMPMMLLPGPHSGGDALALRALMVLTVVFATATAAAGDDWTLVGWNNLGLHCMDPDYGVFALLPPSNTLEAQLVDADGHLVRMPDDLTVTYEAVADPTGSRNSTSIGKTNFWQFVAALFGVAPAPDVGLAGFAMPGEANRPQAMAFDSAAATFHADGIPITPNDDAGATNSYPLMRLTARNAQGAVLASTDVVLPVSDQLNCRACHSSDGSAAAQPNEGWVRDPDPERDTRLNILLLHDDLESGGEVFNSALATLGYDPAGLYATAIGGRPILCASCHLSNALPGSGLPGIEPLTQAVHRRMASVLDPVTGMMLDDVANRSVCYRCHPGAVTHSVRGVMGDAVAPDGTREIQCQSCHGAMRDVAAAERTGWLDEPVCQSCHTGTATRNNGALRYTSAFESDGRVRQTVDATFATNPDTPPGVSLFRYSVGHGGLRCEACHGPTHAESPSSQTNDNLQSERLQGHRGVLAECSGCHATVPNTQDGGPHGLHPLGAAWVQAHPSIAEDGGASRCRTCHGDDYRGTVLSRALGDRTIETDFATKQFFRGFQIGCFTCHQGPDGGDGNPNRAPIAADGHAATRMTSWVDIALEARDPDGDALSMRIVQQPEHGAAGLADTTARYVPEPGFSGTDTFTFTASDGSTDGTLATVTVEVSGPHCAGDCDGDSHVAIDELVRGVGIALGAMPIGVCDTFDANGDGVLTIDELVQGVSGALTDCAA